MRTCVKIMMVWENIGQKIWEKHDYQRKFIAGENYLSMRDFPLPGLIAGGYVCGYNYGRLAGT